MDKADILDAVRRCAEQNGGVPLGRGRFEALTGITEVQWSGRHWLRWSDLIAEAGYTPNSMNASLPDEIVLKSLAQLVRALGHYPVQAELKMKRGQDTSFPSPKVFDKYGNKGQVAARLVEFCRLDGGWPDVIAIAEPIASTAVQREEDQGDGSVPVPGQVYLMRSGPHHKIGRSNSSGRRAYELAIQLPDKLEVVHVIETDDAVGIERYWHERFADRRVNGEWFKLSAADVAAFRRRKRFQ